MIRESQYGDVISETRDAISDKNSSIISPSTHVATVIPSTSTPVHLVSSHSGRWDPGDPETVEINLHCIEVGGWASSCGWEKNMDKPYMHASPQACNNYVPYQLLLGFCYFLRVSWCWTHCTDTLPPVSQSLSVCECRWLSLYLLVSEM